MKTLLLLIAALSIGSAYTIREPGLEIDTKNGLIARMAPPHPNSAQDDGDREGDGSGDGGGHEGDDRGNRGDDGYQPLGEDASDEEIDIWDFEEVEQLLGRIPDYEVFNLLNPSVQPPPPGQDGHEIIDGQRVVYSTQEEYQEYHVTIAHDHLNSQPVRYTTSVRGSFRQVAARVYQSEGRSPGDTLWDTFQTEQLPQSPEALARLMQNWQPFERAEVTSTEIIYNVVQHASTPQHQTFWNPVPEDDFSHDEDFFPEEHEALLSAFDQLEEHSQGNERRKRRSVATTITTQEVGAASKNSTADHAAQFRQYLAAYQSVQRNVSNSIFPIFDLILNRTDSQIIHELCWSVYSDMTRLGPKIIGPFSYGMTNFDWMEDQYLGNKTNITSMVIDDHTDPKILSLLATNQMLTDIYDFVWSNALVAANRTGLLPIMDKLERYLLPLDPSIQSQAWTSPQPFADYSYFTARNHTKGNSTA